MQPQSLGHAERYGVQLVKVRRVPGVGIPMQQARPCGLVSCAAVDDAVLDSARSMIGGG